MSGLGAGVVLKNNQRDSDQKGRSMKVVIQKTLVLVLGIFGVTNLLGYHDRSQPRNGAQGTFSATCSILYNPYEDTIIGGLWLKANCNAWDHSSHYNSLNYVDDCRPDQDIANCNGVLTCGPCSFNAPRKKAGANALQVKVAPDALQKKVVPNVPQRKVVPSELPNIPNAPLRRVR